MAGKASKRFPKSKPDKHNPTGLVPDTMDAKVSGLLQKPTDISSGMKQDRRPDSEGDSASLTSAESARMIQSGRLDEAICAQSKLDLLEIRDEIEETLIQMEQGSLQGIAAADQKEAIEKPSSLPATDAEAPVPEHLPQSPAGAPAVFSKIDEAEQEAWKSLETLRSIVASRRPSPNLFQRRRSLVFATAAVVLALFAGWLYFTYSDRIPPVSEMPAHIQDSGTKQVQDSGGQVPGGIPLDDDARADEEKHPAPAPPAKKIRSSRKTGPVRALVGEHSEEKSAAEERAEDKPIAEEPAEEKPVTPAESVSNPVAAEPKLQPVPKRIRWVEVIPKDSESRPEAPEQALPQTPAPQKGGASPEPAAQSSRAASSAAPTASRPDTGNTPSPSRTESKPTESSSPREP